MMTEQLESEMREMCNLSVGVMEQNRTEDIIRATSDPQFKITLYQEFGIE